jgi:hypothetical protein
MTAPSDPTTRATRLAANAAALAVLAWAALFLVTKQISWVETASPFANDPWDFVVSYAAIFLPLVVGATWIRSRRHRGPHLDAATARRIRAGVTLTLVIIGVNVVSDAVALVVVPAPALDGRLAVIIGLVIGVGTVALAAAALLMRAMRLASPAPRDADEPDLLDDLLGLVAEVPGAARVARPVDRFLATSGASPRRHRIIFGLLAAVVAGLAFDAWHAIVEGPSGSPLALAVFATLAGGGVFVIYLITLVPLRLIRPAN